VPHTSRMSGMGKKRRRKNALLLHDLACALNACERAGLNPKLGHGTVFTDAGFVLPLEERKGKWAVRIPRKHH
jgi:hypothetical protein